MYIFITFVPLRPRGPPWLAGPGVPAGPGSLFQLCPLGPVVPRGGLPCGCPFSGATPLRSVVASLSASCRSLRSAVAPLPAAFVVGLALGPCGLLCPCRPPEPFRPPKRFRTSPTQPPYVEHDRSPKRAAASPVWTIPTATRFFRVKPDRPSEYLHSFFRRPRVFPL